MENLKFGYKLFFIGILGVALFFLLVAAKGQNDRKVISAVFDTVSPNAASVVQPVIETEKMDSPDGTKTLKINKTIWPDKINYQVITAEVDGSSELLIQNRETANSTKLEIPYNSWAPDNSYFFLKEISLSGSDYLVFSASAELFPEEKKQLNVKELFFAKYPEHTITEITGWGTVTSLIVNTLLGEEKISFWFNVKNQTFTRLGNYFD